MENNCKNIAEYEVENFGVKIKMCETHKSLTLTIIKPEIIKEIPRSFGYQCEVNIKN
jgi:hypothetical protein